MRVVEVISANGGGVFLHVPDGWDCFIFMGYLYALVDGKFACVEKLPEADDV